MNVFPSKWVCHQDVDLPVFSILEVTFIPFYISLPCCPRCNLHYVLLQNHLGNLFLCPCLAYKVTNTYPEGLKTISNNNKPLADICSTFSTVPAFPNISKIVINYVFVHMGDLGEKTCHHTCQWPVIAMGQFWKGSDLLPVTHKWSGHRLSDQKHHLVHSTAITF